jgi:aspartyl/asparaginyl-tRNA synthetase
MSSLIINSHKFSFVANRLRQFFLSKKYVEVHTQNRLSILAACEDPSTISIYNYAASHWPLPQTGQMWLEYELLKDPKPPGYFCVSTSYRNEPEPIPGRHEIIFPMFEFELKGDFGEMQKMENELLSFLGYTANESGKYPEANYEDIAKKLNVSEITSKEEMSLYKDGKMPVFFLKNFPEYTSPFWNMKRHDNDKTKAKKVDIILSGMETIGSAERCCDKDAMRHRFNTISGGKYAKLLYNQFGRERVDREMDEFLSHNFITRSGGGIGMTRLIRSMELEGLIPKDVVDARK